MGQGALMQVLHQLPRTRDKDLIAGLHTADDAAVYRVSDSLAIVETLDFFPPIVDDPYTFGQIAAANAMSDVYAMGATPRLAQNIVGFPSRLPLEVLHEIIRGSVSKLEEAGVVLVGGHTIEDREVKYGLSVTGFVHPEKVVTNSGARPGDALVLTKPIGTGVVTTALKYGRCIDDEAASAIESMRALNRIASDAMVEAGASACTDITGFGLLGHAVEMCEASGVSMVIRSGAVRLLPGATGLVAKKKNRPRTIESNMEFLSPRIRSAPSLDKALYMLFFDPQTSGGLFISLPGDRAPRLVERLVARGVDANVIGEVVVREKDWAVSVE